MMTVFLFHLEVKNEWKQKLDLGITNFNFPDPLKKRKKKRKK